MNIKEYRQSFGITEKEAAIISSVPIRTYIRYENDEKYGSDLKRKSIYNALKEKLEITEENGLLTIEKIKAIVFPIFELHKNEIRYCYLFGSYAKGYAKENSDIDLLISTDLTGFKFLKLIEELHTSLNKKIDLLRASDLKSNFELLDEIMKDGIKIYG